MRHSTQYCKKLTVETSTSSACMLHVQPMQHLQLDKGSQELPSPHRQGCPMQTREDPESPRVPGQGTGAGTAGSDDGALGVLQDWAVFLVTLTSGQSPSPAYRWTQVCVVTTQPPSILSLRDCPSTFSFCSPSSSFLHLLQKKDIFLPTVVFYF